MDYKKFILRVMAGTDYDKQEEVHVNTLRPIEIDTEDVSARIFVRVKDFRGMFSLLAAPFGANTVSRSP